MDFGPETPAATTATTHTTHWLIPADVDLPNWLETTAAAWAAPYTATLGARAVDAATEATYRNLVAGLPAGDPLACGVRTTLAWTGAGQDLDAITVTGWRHPDGNWAVTLTARSNDVHDAFSALDAAVARPSADAWFDELDGASPWLVWHPHPSAGAITWAALMLLRSDAYEPWDVEEAHDVLRFAALDAAASRMASAWVGQDPALEPVVRERLLGAAWGPVSAAEDEMVTESGLFEPDFDALDAAVGTAFTEVGLSAAHLAGDAPVPFASEAINGLVNAAADLLARRWRAASSNGR